ncbi:hypothetical protein BTN49_2040 [Candidatus Enterovibrio escicola]|uniref:Mobile element protein n=1 Tax=Candidatus Enterovibrio escicola TaxID=1927127 RepID=A0A2A5T2F1_9GAMM|nr:hypothetical protein BTN49_2040 [Candidatus Enterovibrio escacola]
MMTIVIVFHQSGYRDFKTYYIHFYLHGTLYGSFIAGFFQPLGVCK